MLSALHMSTYKAYRHIYPYVTYAYIFTSHVFMYTYLPICHLSIIYPPIYASAYHLITSRLVLMNSHTMGNDREALFCVNPRASLGLLTYLSAVPLPNSCLAKGRSHDSWGLVSQTGELFYTLSCLTPASKQTSFPTWRKLKMFASLKSAWLTMSKEQFN